MHTLKIIAYSDFIHLCILSSSLYKEWAWKYSSTMGGGTLRYTPSSCFDTFPFLNCSCNNRERLLEIGRDYYCVKTTIMQKAQMGVTKLFNLFNDSCFNAIQKKDENLDDISFTKKYGKNALLLRKHSPEANWIFFSNEIYKEIIRLRILQQELDKELLSFYGWEDILLNHDFYEQFYLSEKDNIRFTIHPDARKKILMRLLMLNHKTHGEER